MEKKEPNILIVIAAPTYTNLDFLFRLSRSVGN